MLVIDHQRITINGNRTYESSNPNLLGTQFLARLARCTTVDDTIWPSASNVVTVVLYTSTDNGVTWVEWGGFTSPGGITTDLITGGEETETIVYGPLPPNINRLRIDITTTSVLKTDLTVEVN